MQLTINGETREYGAVASLLQLIEQLNLDTKRCAIECNQAIVPKALYKRTQLKEGDILEIVAFMGGG